MAGTYDVIIVGAGSTGGALAAKLSEDPDLTVLLLEGGPVYSRVEDMPQDLLLPGLVAAGAPGHPNNWAYMGEVRPGLRLPYPRGKGLGGSSSINGCYYIRGTRDDFDTWVKLGNDEWAFDKVQPYFKRMERDLDFDDDAHGSAGPIPVMREARDRSPEFTSVFDEGCHALGFGDDPDKNNPRPEGGVGPVPLNIFEGHRVGTALGYLLPATGRPNLTIVGNAVARRVLTEKTRAVGIEAVVDGRRQVFHGAEIVISAGALRSPHLLMVSGIGPAEHLRAHGVDVVHHLPGVGRHMTDHPMVSAAWDSRLDLVKQPDRGAMTSVLHWTDEGSDLEVLPFVTKNSDMLGVTDVFSRPVKAAKAMLGTSPKAVTRQARALRHAMLGIVVEKQESRGGVTLVSGDPDQLPDLRWNLLTEPKDYVRFRAAIRVAFELFNTSGMREIGASIVGLDARTVGDDKKLDQWACDHVVGGHPSSTCRMGPASDDQAVVDQRLRVHGIDGLRVADTSIFPSMTSRGPNATAMMIGEYLADIMKNEAAR
jgi:choline dehydrogenase